jgi:hypothetical protein
MMDWVVPVHPLASWTVTVWEPALRPVKSFGDVANANEPPSICNWYGAVPPKNLAVIVPSLPPLQLTSVLVRLRVGLWLTFRVPAQVVVHPLWSVMDTV